MSKRYLIHSSVHVNKKAIESKVIYYFIYAGALHDEMTETIYETPLTSFSTNNIPEEVQIIPILEEGEFAVERVSLLSIM